MLNWGVIGAGGIAYVFCNGMRFTDTGQIHAVASRTPSKADRFMNDFGVSRHYSTYEDLLADEEIDAVLYCDHSSSTCRVGDQMC